MNSIHSPVEHGENPTEANKNTDEAICFGLAHIALAIFVRDVVPSATASSSELGRYAIASVADQEDFYWKMDTATGAVQKCLYDMKTFDLFGRPCN